MTLTEHHTEANFDPRSPNYANLTLELQNLVHLDKTPPRKFHINCPFTNTSEYYLGVSGHFKEKYVFPTTVPNHRT